MASGKEQIVSFQYVSGAEQVELQAVWEKVRQQHNVQDNQYTSKEVTVQWLRNIPQMKRQESQQNFYEDLIGRYLSQIHQLDENNITSIQFRFPQALELLNWYRKSINPKSQQNSKILNNSSLISQPAQNQNTKSKILHNKNPVEKKKQNREQQQQQKYLYPHDHADNKNQMEEEGEGEEEHGDKQDQEDLDNQFGMGASGVKQLQNKEAQQKSISKNYKQYLKLVFDHYCRMSYATGNDPTFQQIQHKTHIMTINKFMIFCKEFGVIKLNSMNRTYLLELFKKNAEFFKEMDFEQFIQTLVKIGQIVYNQQSKDQPTQDSKQFEQLLLFLEVNNLQAFKKKMQTLNIAYRPKNTANIIKKTQPKNYKFKYGATNGRSEQQVKEEIKERKKIRSQNKLNIIERNKKIRQSQPQQKIKPNTSSSSVKNKLAPPKPPVRRVTAQNISRNNTDGEIVGYANIYKMKKNKQGNNSRLKLNSVVEDAKKIVSNQDMNNYNYLLQSKLNIRDRQTPISDYEYINSDRQIITNSEYSRKNSEYQLGLGGSRNLSNLSNTPYRYEPNIFSKAQKTNRKNMPNSEDIGDILGSDEEDEYLNEHLHREKKNDHISKRIQAKIKAINQD